MITLADLKDPGEGGQKAWHLAELLRAGCLVPDGVVLPWGAPVDAGQLIRWFGDVPLAVRSSGVREDTADASFAGMYDTVLDVRGKTALVDAISAVRSSADADRVRAYGGGGPLAVLIQPMLDPVCAGVAFTADPTTGERDRVRISAIPGVGAALVDGSVVADEWVVTDAPIAIREPHGALDTALAGEIAALARRVETHAGSPQDIEWAWDGARLWLLQARPMTALPESGLWEVPKGGWLRAFRLGEYLAGPPTPLFHTWAITAIERRMADRTAEVAGVRYALPWHQLVNGWYFTSPIGSSGPLASLGLLRRPRYFLGFGMVKSRPDLAARITFDRLVRHFEEVIRPSLEAEVAGIGPSLDDLPVERLPGVVDRLLDATGDWFAHITVTGGMAWKFEATLARFYRDHLDGVLAEGHQALLVGLSGTSAQPAHVVDDLDWAATDGERSAWVALKSDAVARREAAEATCRAALTPRRQARFHSLLAVVQRYGRLREEQGRDVSLAWPVIRRALDRLGAELVDLGVIDAPGDVHFVEHDELRAAVAGDGSPLQGRVAERRGAWTRHRALVPPSVVGALPRALHKMIVDGVHDMKTAHGSVDGALVSGLPASPGIGEGPVRILLDLADADRFADGDVLVCPNPSPGWTPLYARAAAIVTDAGTLAAHASLVARELGVPCVVATLDATRRLADGAQVRVDGSLGAVFAADQQT